MQASRPYPLIKGSTEPTRKGFWHRANTWASYLSLVLLAWFFLGSLCGWLFGYRWMDFMRNWIWPILLSAVVGYFTNFIAVTMLFRPYSDADAHWLKWVTLGLWRLGVIPERKPDLARAAARRVAEDLLKPEQVGNELVTVFSRLLDDSGFRASVRQFIGPVLRANLQVIVDYLTPEIMSMLRKGVREGFHKEAIIGFLERVLSPVLLDANNRRRFVDRLIMVLQSRVPDITNWLREAVERYKATGWLRSVTLAIAEAIGALNWAIVKDALSETLESRSTRALLFEMLGEFFVKLPEFLREEELDSMYQKFRQNASDYLAVRVEDFLKNQLPESVDRLLDSPALWRWLLEDALPKSKPYVISWLESDAAKYIAQEIDFASLIEDELNKIPVEYMHTMSERVAGQELGAIQVLGFLIGGVVGTLYALTWAVLM